MTKPNKAGYWYSEIGWLEDSEFREPAQEASKITLAFGKYSGLTLDEVAETDPAYVVWIADNVKRVQVPRELRDLCEQEVRENEDELYPFGDDIQ